MESIDEVLLWLGSGAGAVVLASWLASWLLEDWHIWHVLSSKKKKIFIMLMAAVLGVTAKIFLLNPEILARISPYLDTVVLIVTAWLTSQVAHKLDQAKK